MTVMKPTLTRAEAAEARAAALGGVDAAVLRGLRNNRKGIAQCREAPRGVTMARSLAFPAELRAKKENRDGKQLYHLTGIASVTDKPYEMWDFFGPYDETVERGAFTDTLAASPDVAFLVNHRGVTMARTTAGSLELGMVDEGFGTDAWLNPARQDVSDLIHAIDDRNIDQMSFAFMLEEGWWSDDFTEFKISKLNLDRGDVSAVNYGANPYTSIAARTREILADLDHLPVGAAQAAMARLAGREDLARPQVNPNGRSLAHIEALLEVD